MMAERALMPDYLRLVALFGIVVVNVQYMAFPIQSGFDGVAADPVDQVAVWLVNGLFYLKTYGLFSFMFGVGLAFQMRSAEARSLPFGALYRNRMIGLLVLGLAHACLFFPGDILVIYALVGSVLYLMRTWPAERLVRMGALLLGIQVAVSILLEAFATAPDPFVEELEQELIGQGGFFEAVVFRSLSFLFAFPFLLLFQGIAALGWFCLGLAATKSGLIARPDHPLWVKARRWCLVPGTLLSLSAAGLWMTSEDWWWQAAVIALAPFATAGYLGLIARLARPVGPFGTRILTAGGSSLSIYLGQSILLSTLFGAYGFGLWSQVGPAAAVAIALGTTALLVVLLMLWRTWFEYGPFEGLLRKITLAGVRQMESRNGHRADSAAD